MPVVKGNLQEANTKKIRKNYTYLLSEIDGAVLVDYLYQEEVFDLNDKEEIGKQVPERKRTDLLLTKLLRSGPHKAYDVFLKAVREHYPHVAERLEGPEIGENVGELQEMYSTHTQKDIKVRTEIIEELDSIENMLSGMLCWDPIQHDSKPLASFNIKHLPEVYQFKEVEDCVHSLAEQTVLAVGLDQSETSPDEESWIYSLFCSGRVWRVQKNFSTVNNKTCPCEDCKGSTTPRKRWGEYIVITDSKICCDFRCDDTRFVLGYDSQKKVSDVSVLQGVSVIRSDDSLGYAEILCITHDADTSKRVEDICHRNNVNREKLLSRCHLLQKDKKLAVLVSHPDNQPKEISVGEWLENEGDETASSSSHVYTAVGCYNSEGGPVLLFDGRNAFVTLHHETCNVDLDRDIGYSCGVSWPL